MNLETCLIFVALIYATHGHVLPKDFTKANEGNMTWEEALAEANRVLDLYPLVDGHNDLPWQFRRRLENDVTKLDLTTDVNEQWGASHTDIPRLREGKVGGQFWSVYMNCAKQYRDAVRATMEQIDVARRMIDMYPDDFEYVTTAQGIEDAHANGKIGGLMGIEGGHQIDSSMAALRMFYDSGVRYVTLTHSCTTPWADASPEDDNETPTHNGLTDWGKLVVREMNRIGMLVDLSHVSKPTMEDTLEVTEAPIIFSHSSAYALCNNHRNVQDDVLRKVADNGGIVMVTFVGSFLGCPPSDNKDIDASLVADHIEHIANTAGHDYVGIGGDFDGFSGVPEGLEDVSGYPNLFAELVLRGWSEENLKKLAGQNLVRVFREVEEVRDQMSRDGILPINDWIPEEDLLAEHFSGCRTREDGTLINKAASSSSSAFTLMAAAIVFTFFSARH